MTPRAGGAEGGRSVAYIGLMRGPATPSLSFGALSDVGIQRQGGINQDAVLAQSLPNGGLFAVADGMGGHAAGELAANLALDTVRQQLAPGLHRSAAPVRLAEAVQAANMAVLRHAVGEYVGMGTTLLVGLVDRGALLIAHVGDSRAYLLRGGQLYRLTEDHSWVAEQVRLGHLTEEDARQHQWRSVVSNALGAEERVRLELYGLILKTGDRVLLCSDGLSSVVKESALLTLLSAGHPPKDTAQRLIAAANAGGGPDNITAVVVDVEREGRPPGYELPVRRSEGPVHVDVLVNTQKGNSMQTYLMLTLAYFTLLGVILLPSSRTLVGTLGVAVMVGLMVAQRLSLARQARAFLAQPAAARGRPGSPDAPRARTDEDPRRSTGSASSRGGR